MLNNEEFQTKNIELKTNGSLTRQEILDYLDIKPSQNTFTLKTSSLQEKLLERPDLKSAQIERKLPAGLSITIEERSPIAWIECSETRLFPYEPDASLLIDAEGNLFTYNPKHHPSAKEKPVLHITPPANGQYQAGMKLDSLLSEQILGFLSKLNAAQPPLPALELLSLPNEWSFLARFANGMEITFGVTHHERQINDLQAILIYANSQQKHIQTANLLPEKNIPVTYGNGVQEHIVVGAEIIDDEGSAIPGAEIVEDDSKPAEGSNNQGASEEAKDSGKSANPATAIASNAASPPKGVDGSAIKPVIKPTVIKPAPSSTKTKPSASTTTASKASASKTPSPSTKNTASKTSDKTSSSTPKKQALPTPPKPVTTPQKPKPQQPPSPQPKKKQDVVIPPFGW